MPLGFCGVVCLCPKLRRTDAHSDCIEKKQNKTGFERSKYRKNLTYRDSAKIYTVQTGQ